ncbi:MAG: serine/threonine protein kinase [Desulfovibrio sp.]|uniref:serine/threonine protein kinase n=1 Tax=Desulfovibrio sp. TaxID=885 RepID=UPI0039E67856
MPKKQLSAAQGIEAACILFSINTDAEGMVRLAHSAQLPSLYLEGTGAICFCSEWRAFTHAVVTAGLMQYAPNSVLMGYLRQTGNLLQNAAQAQPLSQTKPVNQEPLPTSGSGSAGKPDGLPSGLEAFVDGPFAQYMPLLAQSEQSQCPELFCQRLAVETARVRGEASPLDNQSKARLAAVMAMLISAVWDKLEQYEILAD